MSVLATVRKAISESGLSPYRIEQETGVTASSVYKFVEGSTDITAKVLDRVCDFFGYELRKTRKGRVKNAYPGRGRPKKRKRNSPANPDPSTQV